MCCVLVHGHGVKRLLHGGGVKQKVNTINVYWYLLLLVLIPMYVSDSFAYGLRLLLMHDKLFDFEIFKKFQDIFEIFQNPFSWTHFMKYFTPKNPWIFTTYTDYATAKWNNSRRLERSLFYCMFCFTSVISTVRAAPYKWHARYTFVHQFQRRQVLIKNCSHTQRRGNV